jgi:hypothetical protein
MQISLNDVTTCVVCGFLVIISVFLAFEGDISSGRLRLNFPLHCSCPFEFLNTKQSSLSSNVWLK